MAQADAHLSQHWKPRVGFHQQLMRIGLPRFGIVHRKLHEAISARQLLPMRAGDIRGLNLSFGRPQGISNT